jgi:FlaA1/EpsC-like NDP-sugar epimerase
MLFADAVVLPASLLVAAWLVSPRVIDLLPTWIWAIPLVVGLSGLGLSGAYRSVVRFMGFELVVTAFRALTLAALALLLAIVVVDNWPDALRVSAAFWLLGMVYVVGGRLTVRWFLQARNAAGDRVVIYGAGDAGAHLVTALRGRGEFVPIAFIDDNLALHRSVINGLEVHSAHELSSLIEELGVSRSLGCPACFSRCLQCRGVGV